MSIARGRGCCPDAVAIQLVPELESAVAGLTERAANNEARRDSLNLRIAELGQRRDRLQARAAEIASQKFEIEADSPDAAELADAEAALGQHQSNLMDRRNCLNKAESARAEAEEQSRNAVSTLHSAQAKVTELQAEDRALEKILSTVENDLFPPVIDALEVAPGFEAAPFFRIVCSSQMLLVFTAQACPMTRDSPSSKFSRTNISFS